MIPVVIEEPGAHGFHYGMGVIHLAYIGKIISVIPGAAGLKITVKLGAKLFYFGGGKADKFGKFPRPRHGESRKHIEGAMGAVISYGKDTRHVGKGHIGAIF